MKILNANSIMKRPFIAMKAWQPLVLVVHASRTFDTAWIAKNGIDDVLDMTADHFNVLELCNMTVKPKNTYTGLDEANKTDRDYAGFFYTEDIVKSFKPLFDGVSNYIMLGGRVGRCLRNAFVTVLSIKAPFSDTRAINLFRGTPYSYRTAINEFERVKALGIINDPKLNIHFNAEASYSHIDDDAWKTIEKFIYSWDEKSKLVKEIKENIHREMFIKLIKCNRALLRNAGINVYEHINGIANIEPVSRGEDSDFKVNLYYWPSTEKLGKFLASQGNYGDKTGRSL